MNEKDYFLERMQQAKGKVKDGLDATIIDAIPEDKAAILDYNTIEAKRQTIRTRIGNRIADLRKQANLTQGELAERAHIQRTHVSRIEAGKYAVTFEVVQAIAEALGMTVDIIHPDLQGFVKIP